MSKDIKFKLAMGQMLVEGGALEANMNRAASMIEEAAAQGCEGIVLPECMDVGWTHPSARELGEPVPGKTSDILSRAASDNGIYVAAGITERAGEKIYNTAILVSPTGEILLKHRKINVLTIAQDLYSIGDSLRVVETDLGVVGLDICADNFSNCSALGHSLARMGAQIILSPSAWAVDGDHDNEEDPYGVMWRRSYKNLSRLFGITTVGVSNVGWIKSGIWEGRKCIGCSVAVGPGEEILAQGPYGAEEGALIVVDVELEAAVASGTAISKMLVEKGWTDPTTH
ncbi:carbon-nitrogen hydrolase family protein [Candidatus Hydrogenedentota bacterium]